MTTLYDIIAGQGRCPDGYIEVNGACIKDYYDIIYEVIEMSQYEFEYYEMGGEMIGRFKIGSPYDIDEVPVEYFKQGIYAQTSNQFNITSTNISDEEKVLFLTFTHYNDGVDSYIEIPKDRYGNDVTEFIFGDFHFLPNTAYSMYRSNMRIVVTDDNNNDIGDIPQPTFDNQNPMVEFYLGLNAIDPADYPDALNSKTINEITPTIHDPVSATDNLKWDSLGANCYIWFPMYDGYDPRDDFKTINVENSYTLGQLKAAINYDSINEYLTANISHSSYTNNRREYNLVFVPPSFAFMQMDIPHKVIKPHINSLDSYLDEVVIKAYPNYKIDGNIQYGITFFDTRYKDDILFKSSSLLSDESYEEGYWQWSVDGKTWRYIPSGTPTFDNTYITENGIDSETGIYIKYILSDTAHTALDRKSNIYFTITKLDGTKQ